jgi:hypothetical protein
MPKEPELTDIDVYARDYPDRMKTLDMEIRRNIQKGQLAQLIFPTYNKRGWVKMIGIMDGGLVGEVLEDLGEGLSSGERIFFQPRHIWDMRDASQ